MSTDEPLVCAAEVILRVVRGRWAPQLVTVIAEHEPVHFLALGRLVPGISKKVLSGQLRFFRQYGVVERSSTEERQEVFYRLTNRGHELKKAMDGLNDLATRWPFL